MNLALNSKEMEEYLYFVDELKILDVIGIQYIFKFPNRIWSISCKS